MTEIKNCPEFDMVEMCSHMINLEDTDRIDECPKNSDIICCLDCRISKECPSLCSLALEARQAAELEEKEESAEKEGD